MLRTSSPKGKGSKTVHAFEVDSTSEDEEDGNVEEIPRPKLQRSRKRRIDVDDSQESRQPKTRVHYLRITPPTVSNGISISAKLRL